MGWLCRYGVLLGALGCLPVSPVEPPGTEEPAPPPFATTLPTVPQHAVTVHAPPGVDVMVAGPDGAWTATQVVDWTGMVHLLDVPDGGYVTVVWADAATATEWADTVAGVTPGDVLHFAEPPLAGPSAVPRVGTVSVAATPPEGRGFDEMTLDGLCSRRRGIDVSLDWNFPVFEDCLNAGGTVDVFAQLSGDDVPGGVGWVAGVPLVGDPGQAAAAIEFDTWNLEPGVLQTNYVRSEVDLPWTVTVQPVARRTGSTSTRAPYARASHGVVQVLTDEAYHDAADIELLRFIERTAYPDRRIDDVVAPPGLVTHRHSVFTSRVTPFGTPVPDNGVVASRDLSAEDHPPSFWEPALDFDARVAALPPLGTECHDLEWTVAHLQASSHRQLGVDQWEGWRWVITAPPTSTEVAFPDLDPDYVGILGAHDAAQSTHADVRMSVLAIDGEAFDGARRAPERSSRAWGIQIPDSAHCFTEAYAGFVDELLPPY